MNMRQKLWKWSWLVTLPITLVFLFWGEVTLERYITFGVRFNSASAPISLHDIGALEYQHFFREAKLAFVDSGGNQAQQDINVKTINLFVSESNLKRLDERLPHSGFEYVEGGLWDGGKIRKIKLKYRGDSNFHWQYYKKSMRIKTKKSSLYEGLRTFNLIIPKFKEKLHNYLGYKFAQEMGLLAPRCELVNVNMNGQLLGVYLLVEKLEELTLRENGLMPADLYSGELVGMDAYQGISPELFQYPRLWTKNAINNHYPDDSYKPLERLIQLLNAESSEAIHAQLSDLLDIAAWGRFFAFETLTQTFHFDNQHNWRIYYDPYRGVFLPVVWDPVAWHNSWRPLPGEVAQMDIVTSRLHTVLLKNGDFLKARQHAIEDFYNDKKDVSFLQVVDSTIRQMTPALMADPNIRPSDPQESVDAMLRLRAGIGKVFADIKQGYVGSSSEVSYAVPQKDTFQLLVSGRRPITELVLNYAKQVDTVAAGTLHYWINDKELVVDISGTLSVEGSQVRIHTRLLPQLVSVFNERKDRYKMHSQNVGPAYYELVLNSGDAVNRLLDLSVLYGDKQQFAREVRHIERVPFVGMYRVATPQPANIPEVWSDNVLIDGVKTITSEVRIEPGTTVRLASGASLIFRNRVHAIGTKERPIRFIAKTENQTPWGMVALNGQNANGSRFKHIEFEGGSGLKGDLFEYTAMFSVHDVKGVVVENCFFRDSKITDDMVHAVYSDVRFSDCTFERSLMDALDIDISDAVIERCRFVDSGNDSIDLMTSNAVVLDTVIENGGDKAASVGEGSHLLSINNVFRNNAIGVQAKDGSVASIYNTDLIGNDHALDAYKKNWRYNDGGDIYVYKSRFTENDKMITADKKSKIRVFDSYMDRVVATDKRVKIDSSVDQLNPQQPHSSKLIRHKKEVKAMKGFDSRYWDKVDAFVRGADQ